MPRKKPETLEVNKENQQLADKYRKTSRWYDMLDAYWERQYQKMRPVIIGDLVGTVLEVGVGTGRNLSFYGTDVQVTAVDLSPEMLAIAKTRVPVTLKIVLMQADATLLREVPSDHFDWYLATFLYCVMPDHLQPPALDQMVRVLKPGGKFRVLEIAYSKETVAFLKQKIFAPFVRRVYGAEFNRHTLDYIIAHPHLQITRQLYIKGDTHLLIEGKKVDLKVAIEKPEAQTINLEKLEQEMIRSWGSKIAVISALIIAVFKQRSITPQFAFLSFEAVIPALIEAVSGLSSPQSFRSLLYTGVGTAMGFFLPSGWAQEFAGIRAGVHTSQEQHTTHSNRFFAFTQAGKTALSAIVGESIGNVVAGSAGAVVGSAVGAYLGATSHYL
ncbi:MAG: methyltransferase domain-containing protein [Pseudomonadota bacterium]